MSLAPTYTLAQAGTGGEQRALELSEINEEGAVSEFDLFLGIDTRDRFRWRPEWRRAHWSQLIGAVALSGGTVAVARGLQPAEANWTRAGPIDRGMRSLLRGTSATQRDRFARASDGLWHSTMWYPVIIDALAVSLAAHREPDVAWQLLVIDLQAYSLSAFLNQLAQRTIARERPFKVECRDDPTAPGCDDVFANQSFYSGHSTMSFTAAGLTCVQHQYLDFYGGGLGEWIPCGLSLAMASSVALLRVAADKHWLSDTLVGAGMGLAAGWLMPWLVHFRSSREDLREGFRPVVMPYGGPGELGLQWMNAF